MYIAPLAQLIESFERMPGIGHKSAVRLAFHVLNQSEEAVENFADILLTAKKSIHCCQICQDLTNTEICRLCSSPERDSSTICVVEAPKDVLAMEKTHEYKGLYHVLHGVISPMDGIGADEIKVKELLARLSDNTVREIIVATGSTVEGEATALYLARLIKPMGIRVTRIGSGLPVGADLEYADEVTLIRALEGRREI
ncbi:MAG: recombination protein RecR [Clostridia bacterium]|nr:recombination protein RecR [Clostridia bacterium]